MRWLCKVIRCNAMLIGKTFKYSVNKYTKIYFTCQHEYILYIEILINCLLPFNTCRWKADDLKMSLPLTIKVHLWSGWVWYRAKWIPIKKSLMCVALHSGFVQQTFKCQKWTCEFHFALDRSVLLCNCNNFFTHDSKICRNAVQFSHNTLYSIDI